MRIGFIGSGRIGGTLAALFAKQGHEVVVSNSRGPETLADLVAEIGGAATAGTTADAAAADLVVVSIPFKDIDVVPAAAVNGKVVIDTNNYYPARDGQWAELDDDSTTSSELLAARLPGAHVVKAFNTIFWEHLRDEGTPTGTTGRRALPIAGDDPTAKRTVTGLTDSIGFDTVDAGDLAAGRNLQPGSASYGVPTDEAELRALL